MRYPIILAALAVLAASSAEAAGVKTVTRCEDDAAISNTLRGRIDAANADPDLDYIVVQKPCVIELQSALYIDTAMEVYCTAPPPGCLLIGADITSSSAVVNTPLVWIRAGNVVFRNFTLDSGGWVYTGTADNNQDCIGITSPFENPTTDIVLEDLTCRGFRDEGISLWTTGGTTVTDVTIRDVLIYGGVDGHTSGFHAYSLLVGGSGSCDRIVIDRALMIGGQARNPLVQDDCPTSITNSAAINYGSHGIRATGSNATEPTTFAIDSFHCVPGPNTIRWTGGNYEQHCIELVDLQPGSQIYAANMLGPHGYDALADIRPKTTSDPSLQYVVTANPLTFPQPETIDVQDVVPTLLETAGAGCRDATTLDVLSEARKVYENQPNLRGLINTRADMLPNMRGHAPEYTVAGAPPKTPWLTDIDPESASGATKWERWLGERMGFC